MQNALQNRRVVLLGLCTFILFVLFVGFLGVRNGEKIDETPYEGENPNSAKMVIFTTPKELIDVLNNTDAYNSVASELYLFAKIAYPSYSNESQPMGFKITKLKEGDDAIALDGRFGANDNPISVKINQLNAGRIKISITDTTTKLNIDDFLESNTIINQFIGVLPFDGDGYTITYIENEDTFVINVFNDPSNYDAAIAEMKSFLGEELFSKQNVVRYGAGDIPFDNGF